MAPDLHCRHSTDRLAFFYLTKRGKAAAIEDKRPLHIARERMAPNPIRTPQQTAPQSNDPPPTSNPINYRHATPFTPEPTGATPTFLTM